MDVPPVYATNPPKKPKNTVLYVILGLVGLCAICCGGGIFMMFFAMKKAKNLIGCSVNYAITLQAVKQYATLHDGTLPPAKDWQDAILPDFDQGGQKVSNFFGGSDPSGNLGCKGDGKSPETGIAYNKDIAGKKIADLPRTTVVLFEVKSTERNQCLSYKPQQGFSPQTVENQPRQWLWITLGGNTPLSFGNQFGSSNSDSDSSNPVQEGSGKPEGDSNSTSDSSTKKSSH